MASRIPHGHISAAIAAVYFFSKFLINSYSSEELIRISKIEGYGSPTSVNTWPSLYSSRFSSSEDDDDEAEERPIFVIPETSTISFRGWIENYDESNSSVILHCRSILEPEKLFYVLIRAPYNTAFDRLHRRPFDENYLNVPYGSEAAIGWLIKLLSSGKLSYYITEAKGIVRKVPADFWLSEHCEDVLKYNVSTLVQSEDCAFFGRISIKEADIDACFSVNNPEKFERAQDLPAIPSEAKKSRRGRPDKYDVASFHAEVSDMIFQEGYPGTFKELVQKSLDRYEQANHQGGRPSVDTAEEWLRPTWQIRKRANGEGG